MDTKTEQQIAQLRQAGRELVRALGALNSSCGEHGLHLSQRHAMFELHQTPHINILELAGRLNLERSTVSRLIQTLQTRGLVQTESSPLDKRSKLLALTPSGEDALNMVIHESNTIVNAALQHLTDAQYDFIVQGMQLYTFALKEGNKTK